MAGKTGVTVVNTSLQPVWRGGYVFPPRQEKTVRVSGAKLAEVRACAALQVFDPGFRCDQPDCTFVAKNEASLRLHKKKEHNEDKRRLEDEQNNGKQEVL